MIKYIGIYQSHLINQTKYKMLKFDRKWVKTCALPMDSDDQKSVKKEEQKKMFIKVKWM